jgi:hypothetical protein
MTKKTPPSIGQFALSERDDLLATISEQAREIERLTEGAHKDGLLRVRYGAELAALKAQPSAVVMPDVLFDGFTVYEEVLKGRKQQRTSHENVSDTLDAIVRLLRRANPDSARLNASRVPVEPAHSDVIVPRELANIAALHLENSGYTGTGNKLRALLAGGEV